MLDGRSLLHLRTGRWDAAEQDADHVLRIAGDTILCAWAQLTRASLALRRGEPAVAALGRHVTASARRTEQRDQVAAAAAFELERAWHSGDGPDRATVDAGLAALVGQDDPWQGAWVLFWMLRLDLNLPQAATLPPPVAAELAEGPRAAADVWARLGCVYEASLLHALTGTTDQRRVGIEVLTDLRADATLRRVRRVLAAEGVRALPRGPNRARRQHPAGLTPRQVEVLRLLAEGRSNAEIAGELFISPKTTEHHVSAILSRLGASSRAEAAAIARRRRLV